MTILNERTGALVAASVRELTSVPEKTCGLIGCAAPKELLIRTRWGIHTFGVRFPIGVIVLDGRNYARKVAVLPPNRFLFWNPRWPSVLEITPSGANLVRVGDKLRFVV